MRKKLPEVPVSPAEKQDPALHMEMETLRAERDERHGTEITQLERERLIARYHEAIGQIKTANMFAEFARVSELVWIQQMRESKAYKEIGTWESFCASIGYTRQHVEDLLKNLSTFGEKFTQTVCALGVGHRQLRQLRKLAADGTITIEADAIVIGDKTIELHEDNADEVQSAIDFLLQENNQLIERNNKLEKDFKGALKEETKGLNSEIKTYKERVKALEIYEPNEKDREWCVKQMEAIEKAAGAFQIAVAKFVIDPRLKEDRHLQAKVSAHLQEAELSLQDLRTRLDEVIDMFND